MSQRDKVLAAKFKVYGVMATDDFADDRVQVARLCMSGARSGYQACLLAGKGSALNAFELSRSFSEGERREMDAICAARSRIERRARRLEVRIQQNPRHPQPLPVPVFTRSKADSVRRVLEVYFRSIGNGKTETQANTAARSLWERLTGRCCTEKTIRRYAKKVQEAGGIETAPLSAFMDRKHGTKKPKQA